MILINKQEKDASASFNILASHESSWGCFSTLQRMDTLHIKRDVNSPKVCDRAYLSNKSDNI